MTPLAVSPSPAPITLDDSAFVWGSATFIIVSIGVWIILTAVPIIVAQSRGVENMIPTVLLSVFLSWSCIGFFIALIVASSSRTKGQMQAQAQMFAAAQAEQMRYAVDYAQWAQQKAAYDAWQAKQVAACAHEWLPREQGGKVVQVCGLCGVTA